MDWTSLLRDLPALATPAGHADALTLAATRLLRAGDAAGALALAERRCRLESPPGAGDHAVRALACALRGRRDGAGEAARRACAADQLDPTALLVALRLFAGTREALDAARRLLASPLTGPEARGAALAVLFRAGDEATASLDLTDGRLSGFIAWTGEPPPLLVLDGEQDTPPRPLEADPAFPALPTGVQGCFINETADPHATGFRLIRDTRVLAAGSLHARSRRSVPGRRGLVPAAIPARRPLRIVIPVHGDFDATRDCLRAAIRAAAEHGDAEVVAVDDATPLRDLALLLDALAAKGLIELRRNVRNLGFTGAVARGLDGADGRDVLLLNADAILPPSALMRLADAVYAAPDIGTATPLSNNGEWTSLPRLGHAADAPEPAEARRIDAAAAGLVAAGAPGTVDLPNGIGFALFVRHDCLAALGGLSAVYERGYFEDLEFTVRARRLGFRNVAATGVFAVHHGSRSFGAEKGALVAKNLRRFRRRFPGLTAESAAFRRADPLHAARAAIEAACPPGGHPVLVAAPAGSASAAEQLFRHAQAGRPTMALSWRGVGTAIRIELRAGDPSQSPQSLGFDLDGKGDALRDWLRTLEPSALELGGAEAPPAALAAMLRDCGPPATVLLGDLPRDPDLGIGDAPLVRGFRLWNAALGGRIGAVSAGDPLSLAAIEAHLAGRSDAPPVRDEREAGGTPSADACDGPPVLAVLMGRPAPMADRFVTELSAALRRHSPVARILVLGRAFDDLALMGRGNVFVTGRLAPGEVGASARQGGASALALPTCDPSLALFERIRHETFLPAAQADWSLGGLAPTPHHLLTDPRPGDRHSAPAIADWFAARLPA
ncbi:glycosyltransferase [Aureimonas sp. AU12]|uniref:glycosyltransferase n=1 Tax=Aureimonas sp. AU12 TaxID=1638161 RepID=UPI0007825BF7|nr:glycosyltransferase [Aureimonas sp. AU12]